MNTKLFVGGLPWATTDQRLQEVFSEVGTVVSAKVITDKYTHRSKGFGFVEMGSPEEAQAAIDKLNGTDIDGRNIIVSEARPEAPREDRGSYGGDRGRGGRRVFDRNDRDN